MFVLLWVAISAESRVEENGSFEMFPGVVADPAAERLFLMNQQGGIDAIGLASGNLLWTSRDAGKPLAVSNDVLAAQADAAGGSGPLQIVLLSAKSGRVVSSIAVPIPTGSMPPSIDDRMGASSSVNARFERDGLLVSWATTSRRIRPMPGPVKVQNDSGAALINLQTYHVTALTQDEAEARLRGRANSPAPRLSGTEGLYFSPQRVGAFLVSVKLGPASEGQHAVLKRWNADSGEALPDIELGAGFVAAAVSKDESLFLVVRREPTGAGYLWSLYTIANGERAAEFRRPDSSAQSFFVGHSILIYRAAELHGLELNTGKEIWKRGLRDTTYQGSYPPKP